MIRPRLAKLRRDIEKRGVPTLSDATIPEAFDAALGRVTAASQPAVDETTRELRAIRNRVEVERLSRDGMRVAAIARCLDLSTRHVVELRAQLGLGRRRWPH